MSWKFLDDILTITKGVSLIVQSQIGYELRHTNINIFKQCQEIAERAKPAIAGFKSLLDLANVGIYPGCGGYIESDSKEESELDETNTQAVGYPRFCRIKPGIDEEGVLVEEDKQAATETVLLDTSAKTCKKVYQPRLPQGYQMTMPQMQSLKGKNRERRVPSSRIARFAQFGQLGMGLAFGAAAEIAKRTLGLNKDDDLSSNTVTNAFMTKANAEKIVNTLCRVRGAALKLGQMLSIQDPELISPTLLEIFERVRHSADFMPVRQVHRQLRNAFGANWRDRFMDFEDVPFAAASIGQVHRAWLTTGEKVALKIQYPGVAAGIDSDIDNLVTILNYGNFFPKGLYLENFAKVARKELKLECDYKREARAMKMFSCLLARDQNFYVPRVIDDMTTTHILTAEYMDGVPVDKCVDEPQEVRDYIASKFIELCLNEIFKWRFMQTDPNWSNFYIGRHPSQGGTRLILLDFGASRSYPKKFVDQYMRIIRAAFDKDSEKIMEEAHCESVCILGETLTSSTPFDFSKQKVTKRIHNLIPIMLKHRLVSPPEEIYSLHRKLSGSFLLASKLRAVVSCGSLFESIYDQYQFGENVGSEDIDIDDEKEMTDLPH